MDISLQATLTAGPSSATDSTFPSGSTSWPFGLNPDPRAMQVDTGVMVHSTSSPSAYVALGGVGALGPVTKALVLLMRSQSPVMVRLTFSPSGGDFTSIVPLGGALLIEADQSQPITLVEVKGSGKVELYAAGLE